MDTFIACRYSDPYIQNYVDLNDILCQDQCSYDDIIDTCEFIEENTIDKNKISICYWTLVNKESHFLLSFTMISTQLESTYAVVDVNKYTDVPDFIIRSDQYILFCTKMSLCRNFSMLDVDSMISAKKSIRQHIFERNFLIGITGNKDIRRTVHITTRCKRTSISGTDDGNFVFAAIVEYKNNTIGFVEAYNRGCNKVEVLEHFLIGFLPYRIACYFPRPFRMLGSQ